MRPRSARRGPRTRTRTLTVFASSARATRGRLIVGSRSFPCALGRSGVRSRKREGDGATPLGTFRLLAVLWRADRGLPPPTALPRRPIRRHDGWCDAVGDRNYNRPVCHPYPASAEEMWRADDLYDVVVIVEANVRPRVQGLGSAIFMHLARPGYAPTAGCVALTRRDMREVLRIAGRDARLAFGRARLPAGAD